MSKIEWTERSWNPIIGCAIVSPGCKNCYAMRTAHRLGRNPATPLYAGLTHQVNGKAVWTGEMRQASHETITLPLRTRKPTTWFVNSMSDLFAEGASDRWIDAVFAVMALTPQHIYQLLTKRPERMRDYIADSPDQARFSRRQTLVWRAAYEVGGEAAAEAAIRARGNTPECMWPLANVWLGVSAEDQARADERIPLLLDTPAAVRWVSAEPLLGPVSFTGVSADRLRQWNYLTGETGVMYPDGPDFDSGPKIDQVIVGGESGVGARPMHPAWPRRIRDQCALHGTAFFFKQWGEWGLGVGDDAYRARCARSEIVTLDPLDRSIGPNLYRVGKKAAGRLLDGVQHDGMPTP